MTNPHPGHTSEHPGPRPRNSAHAPEAPGLQTSEALESPEAPAGAVNGHPSHRQHRPLAPPTYITRPVQDRLAPVLSLFLWPRPALAHCYSFAPRSWARRPPRIHPRRHHRHPHLGAGLLHPRLSRRVAAAALPGRRRRPAGRSRHRHRQQLPRPAPPAARPRRLERRARRRAGRDGAGHPRLRRRPHRRLRVHLQPVAQPAAVPAGARARHPGGRSSTTPSPAGCRTQAP